MIAAELQLNASGDAYDLFTDWRARRDERAYVILRHISDYAELLYQAGEITADVQRAIQLDVVAAHVGIDVARQTDAK